MDNSYIVVGLLIVLLSCNSKESSTLSNKSNEPTQTKNEVNLKNNENTEVQKTDIINLNTNSFDNKKTDLTENDIVETSSSFKILSDEDQFRSIEKSKNLIVFKLKKGKLKPGEEIIINVPNFYQKSYLDGIIFNHRQLGDKRDWTNGRDPSPGYTTTHVMGIGENTQGWRYWGGSYSGSPGAKFAEVGWSYEEDALYEWVKEGHYSVKDGSFSKELLKISKLKFINTGIEEIDIDKVTIKLLPTKSQKYEEVNFINSSLGDPVTLSKRFYGSKYDMFDNALKLNVRSNNGKDKLPSNWSKENSDLLITIDDQIQLNHVDLLVGDLRPNGRRGGGKVRIGILKKDSSEIIWISNSINIPPQGVLNASPNESFSVLNPKDKIVIRAYRDTVYIMSARIGYDLL